MLSFLADEPLEVLKRESKLLLSIDLPPDSPLRRQSSQRQRAARSRGAVRRNTAQQRSAGRRIASSASARSPGHQQHQQQKQQYSALHYANDTHSQQQRSTSGGGGGGGVAVIQYFPEIGVPWCSKVRRQGRDALRRRRLRAHDRKHRKTLRVMRNVDQPEKTNIKNVDIWDDPLVNERAAAWFCTQVRQSDGTLALAPHLRPRTLEKEVNWFLQGKEQEVEVKPARKVYRPPPPPPRPGPQHPRMLIPVPAIACEPVAHVGSAKHVVHAISCREHFYGKFERTMLLSRAKGVQYLGGPDNLLRRYFALFRDILFWTIKVCRAVEEWRYQLSQIRGMPYHKDTVTVDRPAFMWGGETVSLKGTRRRFFKNYILKMGEDVQCLLKAEMPAKLGKGNVLIMHKARISGDYVNGVEVCPLLLPLTLEELLQGTRKSGKGVPAPAEDAHALPSERWYGLPEEDVLFAAQTIVDERAYVQQQSKRLTQQAAEQLKQSIADSSSFGPSLRASVDKQAVQSIAGQRQLLM